MEETVNRYIAQGIPAETARMLAAYEARNAGQTSTVTATGQRVAA